MDKAMTLFEKHTYKQKFYALSIICILLVLVTYKRVFKITFETKDYIQELEEKKEKLIHLTNDIVIERKQIHKIDKLLGKQNLTVDKVQQDFLTFFETYSEDLIVFQMDEVIRYKHPDFVINTHRIVLRGGFIPTLKFTDKLEKKLNFAKLINVSFIKNKVKQEEKEQLYTTLILQNYEDKR